MPAKPPPLTQKIVDAFMLPLQPDPKTGEYPKRGLLNDGACTGLSIRSGKETPTWIVRATTGGILRKVFGDPRTMSLDIARKIATEARELHHAGGDVSDEWIAAAQVRHGILPEVEEPYSEPPGPWTWQQAAEAWFQQLRHRRRSEVTIEAYRKGLLVNLKVFADMLIRDVTLEMVQDEIDRLHTMTPSLAVQAYKSARPFSQFISIGPQRLKTEVTSNPYKPLSLPVSDRSRTSIKAIFHPVHISEVARLVALCRTLPLDSSTMRAMEVTILTGLGRSAVVSARQDDVRDGVWTVRADALKRKVPMKIELTDRLRELMTSDHPTWIFLQPRKNTRGERKHVGESAVGRAQWEMPQVPNTSECHRVMRQYLTTEGAQPEDAAYTNLLTDAGAGPRDGGDEVTYGGRHAWQIRSSLIEDWGNALEEHVKLEIPKVDVEKSMAHVMSMRPKSG